MAEELTQPRNQSINDMDHSGGAVADSPAATTDVNVPPNADRHVEIIPIAQLKPHPCNARTHTRKQIAQVAASIKRFGFCNPLLVDDGNQIIAGHGRLEAAKQLGLSDVPCLRLSHLTAAEKRAYVLADNKLAEKAGWDRALLAISRPWPENSALMSVVNGVVARVRPLRIAASVG
jgi:ParB/Sulfiredoxin domain